jgi:hypothetical protein
MKLHTLNLFGKKAEFFILTTVVIVAVFYALSRYVNPYAFIDTSKAASTGETFFFDNIKDKAIKTVEISNPSDLSVNLKTYKNFVEGSASDKGYNMIFNYTVDVNEVDVHMILSSQKYNLLSDFTVIRPTTTTISSSTTTTVCVNPDDCFIASCCPGYKCCPIGFCVPQSSPCPL